MRCNCSPFLYTVNTNIASVADGGIVPPGTVVHQQCDDCKLNGDGVICRGRGAFKVFTNITVIPLVATDTTVATPSVTLYQDGQPIPGAVASMTTIGQNQSANLNIIATIRNDTKTSSVITLRVSNCAVSVPNYAQIVEPMRNN